MMRSFKALAMAALGVALVVPSLADAQTQAPRRHAHHPAADGREIIVHPRESWLTAGTGSSFGEFHNYALSTFTGGAATFVPNVDNTAVGVRGLERVPNNFTVPGCCFP
jgi:hypothetical protein